MPPTASCLVCASFLSTATSFGDTRQARVVCSTLVLLNTAVLTHHRVVLMMTQPGCAKWSFLQIG